MADKHECSTRNFTFLQDNTFEVASTSMQVRRKKVNANEKIKIHQFGEVEFMVAHEGEGNMRVLDSQTDNHK